MPNISRAAKRQNIVLVIATLLEHGPIVSDKGEAFHDLYLLCKKAGVLWEYATALRTLVNQELLSQGIAQVTERVGARGYTRIELLAIPSGYEDEVQEFLNKRETVPVPIPLPEPERTPEPMPIAAVYDGPTADEVANSILNRVMEIHNRPAQYEIKEQRLREALEQRDASVRRASDYRDATAGLLGSSFYHLGNLIQRQREELASTASREESGRLVLKQPLDMVAIRRLVEREAIGEVCDWEREQSRSNFCGKLFRRHLTHVCPSQSTLMCDKPE